MLWWISAVLAANGLENQASVFILENGLTVILNEDHRTDEIALHLRYRVGSRDEQPGEYGCAHLFEHLMFEGSRHVPGNDFDRLLSGAGGENNAWTSEDETAYHMRFPSGAADLALFLESDRMGWLRDGLTVENIENQQRVVLQERAEDYTQPRGRDADTLTRLLFPENHPYHHPVIGTLPDVQGFSVEKVEAFWQKHYRPRNAVLVLVGNFDTVEMLDKVTNWFAEVPDLGPSLPRLPDPPISPQRLNAVIEDAVEERTLYLAWPLPAEDHPDMPALTVLSYLLSSGRGSRLDDALYYNSKLANDDNAYAYRGRFAGSFQVYATAPTAKLTKIERTMEKIIRRLEKTPPSLIEFERVQRKIINDRLDQLEYPEDQASELASCWIRESAIDCHRTDLAAIEKVSPNDISRVIATWLKPEHRRSLSVVPWGKANEALAGSRVVELP